VSDRPQDASLRGQQLWFAGAVMRPDAAPEHAGRAEAQRMLTAGPRLDVLERLAIYQRGYVARLVECLADDYPALQHALGEDVFAGHCDAYIAAYPSTQPSLNFYGRRMADFCRARPAGGVVAPELAADLAALEWAMVDVIHAPSTPPLQLEGLREVPPDAWGDARLIPNSALCVLRSGYPVNPYFQAWRDGREAPLPQPAPSAAVVWRSGPTVWRMDLTAPMHAVLSALLAGDTLGTALERVADSGDDAQAVAARVMSWFREWVQGGLFARIEVPQR
jgi:hypothetical protein